MVSPDVAGDAASHVPTEPLSCEKALQPVGASIQRQRNFVAADYHELKTPLAVIHINAETMPEGNLEQKQRVILDECDRMSGLIRSLLTLASSNAGNWKMNMNEANGTPYSLRYVCRNQQ